MILSIGQVLVQHPKRRHVAVAAASTRGLIQMLSEWLSGNRFQPLPEQAFTALSARKLPVRTD